MEPTLKKDTDFNESHSYGNDENETSVDSIEASSFHHTSSINKESISKDSSTMEMLNCIICNYKATSNNNYQSHIATHADPVDMTTFKCLFCSHRAKTLLNLREHMFVHEDLTERFKCFICNVFCKSKTDFNDHMWLHKNLDRQHVFECIYCDHEAYNVNTIKMHMLTHKNSIAVQQCGLCPYKSKSKGDLLRHLTTHKESPALDTFKCHICEYKTKHLRNLRCHLLTHSGEIELFRTFLSHMQDDTDCSETDNSLQKEAHLERRSVEKQTVKANDVSSNTSEVRLPRPPLYQCGKCSFNTNMFVAFNCHLRTHLNLNERRVFNCPDCDSTFTRKSALKTHSWLHVNPEKRPSLQCDKCDYRTMYRTSLNQHLKSKHSIEVPVLRPKSKKKKRPEEVKAPDPIPDENPTDENSIISTEPLKYQCKLCSFGSDLYTPFKRHRETHKDRSERELFTCPHCDKTFTTKPHLKLHSLLHMNPEERPLFPCEYCKFKTMYKGAYKKHMKSKHPEQMPDFLKTKIRDKRMVYRCKECFYKSKILINFKRHEETHKDRSERELYQCATCNSTYTSKLALKEHIFQLHIIANNAPKYECYHCDFTTADKSEIKSHRLEHKGIVKVPKEVKVRKRREKRELTLLKCKECDYETKLPLNFKRHEGTHQDRSVRNLFQCATCPNASYTTKKALTNHIVKHHVIPKRSNKYECYDCKFTCTNELEMDLHRLEHVKKSATLSAGQQNNSKSESVEVKKETGCEYDMWIKNEVDADPEESEGLATGR